VWSVKMLMGYTNAVDFPSKVPTCIIGICTIQILPIALFELHGNSNLEKCEKCNHEYIRDYDCCMGRYDHLTGRKCDDPKCNGNLKDTIIHFEESLPLGKYITVTCITFL